MDHALPVGAHQPRPTPEAVPVSVANHESSHTTRLYDRTSDAISLDEIEGF